MHIFNAKDGTTHKTKNALSGYRAYLSHEYEPLDLYKGNMANMGTLSDGRRHSSNLFDDLDSINRYWLGVVREHLRTKRA
jgi:hypothetical protein